PKSVKRLFQAFGLPHVGVKRAMVEGIDAELLGLGILIDEELDSTLGRDLIAKRVHVAELPRRIDVEERERQRAREEGFLRQVQHDGAVLADRIKEDRPLGLRGDFPEDLDALGFELLEMA